MLGLHDTKLLIIIPNIITIIEIIKILVYKHDEINKFNPAQVLDGPVAAEVVSHQLNICIYKPSQK